jgi:chemotaxis protein methyltransferase WspC
VPPASGKDPLSLAREAADGGRLDEAAALCRRVLAESAAGGPDTSARDADALCLLGVICQARGEIPDAEKHFHKALYLLPRHHEALVHLMLLAQQRGDQPAAGNYRRRAEQADPAGG